MDRTDAIVVGAGVVGLAVARALARAGREVIVLERERLIGSHTSARNSEVIHAGIYYPKGSAKARLCVAGKRMLYAYAAAAACRTGGSARSSSRPSRTQEGALDGDRRGGGGPTASRTMRPLSRAELAGMEPALRASAGLLSRLDRDHRQPRADAEPTGRDRGRRRARWRFAPGSLAARPVAGGSRSSVDGRAAAASGSSSRRGSLVNAAGLFAGEVAAAIEGLRAAHAARGLLLQGQLFQRVGRVPFGHLIYPVPERDGLGVHLTLDMAGQGALRAGHRVGRGHRLQPRRRAAARASTPRSAATGPGSADGALTPDYTGIRPKLAPAGGAATDFLIEGPETHGLAGPRQPLRHREPGPHRLARHRRGGGGAAQG